MRLLEGAKSPHNEAVACGTGAPHKEASALSGAAGGWAVAGRRLLVVRGAAQLCVAPEPAHLHLVVLGLYRCAGPVNAALDAFEW